MKRGSSIEVSEKEKNLVCVTWMDNRAVTLLSNFVGLGKEDQVRRWDKKLKEYVNVSRPEVVQAYNYSMGGVDKIDFLLSLYRIFIRSKKWTQRYLFHFIDLAICNSWILFRMICEEHKIPKKSVLSLLEFRMSVAEALLTANLVPASRKRGRPSKEVSSPIMNAKSKPKCHRPCIDSRFDQICHLPDNTGIPQRCKLEGCTYKSTFTCEKCKVALCLKQERNCFRRFHVR